MTERIKTIFSSQKPNLTILSIYRLSNIEYLVEAVEDTNMTNMNDPFYLVNIRSATVKNYLPMADLERFSNATENHVIYRYRKM